MLTLLKDTWKNGIDGNKNNASPSIVSREIQIYIT